MRSRRQRPEPLVPRALRFGVERAHAISTATIARPLSAANLRRDSQRSPQRSGAESFAICLLHSYANPKSEERSRARSHRLAVPLSRLASDSRRISRIRTALDHGHQRVRRAADVLASETPRSATRRCAPARDAIQRQRDRRAHSRATNRCARSFPVRPPGVVGAARAGARDGRRSLHHLRHGRHFDRRVAVRSARAQSARSAIPTVTPCARP